MRIVLQVVSSAKVNVDGKLVGQCRNGFLLYVGVAVTDTENEAKKLADRISKLRIFPDSEGRLNLDIFQYQKERKSIPSILAVSNFTVYGDVWSGRRPSFVRSAHFGAAQRLFETFVGCLREVNLIVDTGKFGANMEISSINMGPLTLVIDA